MDPADDRSKPHNASGDRDETRASRVRGARSDSGHETVDGGRSMLAGGDESAPTLASGGGGTTVHGSRLEQPGAVIGRYKLLQQIGEGGFGSVFLAEQREPVVRKVALKIIKLGMDTRQVIARFEQERQALALMDHPNIAKVLDAGATDTGRPFFVMEFCTGESITHYCDKNNLTVHERLGLFVQVCQAVQHAHQKGLIHRDIKPGNILVSTQDNKPHAKVIDFGIAKATSAKLTEKTLFTAEAQFIGTPQYMSPEQAEGSLDIDTRTDVYALGVLLYELLTGVTPFDPKSLRSAAYAEMQRIIREVEPPSPSTRLSQNTATIAGISASRRTEPRKLSSMIRGELDWIVMKALEKERQRRYETANSFAADVLRYLAGEPVVAAPVSAGYRFRKFVKRNKGPVIAAGGVAAALVLGLAGTIWQASVAAEQRDKARSEAARAVTAEAEAHRRADELQKVADFQGQMLAQVDAAAAGMRLTSDVRTRFEAALTKAGLPENERAAEAAAFSAAWSRVNATDTALELIDSTILKPALIAIDRQFADQPKVNATLRAAIGARYLDLGLLQESRAVTAEVLNIRRNSLGEDAPDTIATVLGDCKALCLSGKPAEAEAILRPLIARHRTRLGPDDPLVYTALDYLGEALTVQNQHVEAEALLREALAGRRRVHGDDHENTLASIGNLAMALRGQAKFAEAESFTKEGLERRRRLYGEEHSYTLTSYNNLAVIYLEQGRFQEAVDHFQKVAEGRRRELGEAHRDTLLATNNLAAALGRLAKHEEAEAIQRELLERTTRILGRDNPDTLMMLSNLSSTLISLGRLDEAEPLCRESLDRRLRAFGANHPGSITANNVMSFLLRRRGNNAEAEPFLRKALDAANVVYGPDHPERMVLLLNMGVMARDLGRREEGERCLREAIERCGRTLGPEHPYTQLGIQSLGETLFQDGKFAEVVQLLAEAEPAFRKTAATTDDADLRLLLLRLGRSRAAKPEFAAAEANLIESHALYAKSNRSKGRGALECIRAIADLYTAWDAAVPGGGYDAKAADWKAKLDSAIASTQPAATAPAQPDPQHKP